MDGSSGRASRLRPPRPVLGRPGTAGVRPNVFGVVAEIGRHAPKRAVGARCWSLVAATEAESWQHSPSLAHSEVLERVPDPALEAAARLWKGAAGASVSAYLLRRESVRSPISASDLIELGLQPGHELGEELRKIEALIWDAELDPEDRPSVARLKQRIRLSR